MAAGSAAVAAREAFSATWLTVFPAKAATPSPRQEPTGRFYILRPVTGSGRAERVLPIVNHFAGIAGMRRTAWVAWAAWEE